MDSSLSGQIWLIIFLIAAAAFIIYYFYYRKNEKNISEKNAYLFALKYIAEGDTRRAVEKLKETVRKDTNNIDAYIKLGDILRREGLVNNAIRIHKDLTLRGNINKNDLAKTWFSLGLDYRVAEKYGKAKEAFLKIKDDKEYHDRIFPLLLRTYEQISEFEKSFELIKENPLAAEEKYKHKMAVYKVLEGLKLFDKNEGKNARILYKEALKYDPGNIFAHLYIGDSYLKDDRRDDAIEVWTKFCKKFPEKSYTMFSRLEKAWYEKGQFNKIEELYTSILKVDATNLQALLALSRILCKKGEYETAITFINDGLQQELGEDALTAELAQIYRDQENFSKSSELALKLVNKFIPGTLTYSCKECGYKSGEPFIICPKCKKLNFDI